MAKNTIGQQIKQFQQTPMYKYFVFGEDYYNGCNTNIMLRRKACYVDGAMSLKDNPYQANHKLPSGYLTQVVDQKVNYLLGNGVTFEDKNIDLNDYVTNDEEFNEILDAVSTEASAKALGWVYFFKDDGKLKLTQIPAEQVIPVYDDKGKIVKIIRYYEQMTNDKVIKVALEYTEEEVIEYKEIDEKKGYEECNRYAHYFNQKEFNGAKVDETPLNFTRLPFIPLFNNPKKLSDLYRIKGNIDIYDIVNSDFANNIDDMQEAFYTIKNYAGEGLPEFLAQLKKYKAVPIGEDGELKAQQLEIPVEAREKFLDITDRNIYKFSMSVDTDKLAGGDQTNVAIKSAYANLDLKADKFEKQVRKFLKRVITFINENDNKSYSAEVKFERSMIVNKLETLDKLKDQVGIISNETLFENHPLVKNATDELKRKEEETKKLRDISGLFGEE